jgi:hypothetical protein
MMNLHRPGESMTVRLGLSTSPDALEIALQDALAQLAEIDANFEQERVRIHETVKPEVARQNMLRELEGRHAHQRKPLVLLLAALYQRQTSERLLPVKPRNA